MKSLFLAPSVKTQLQIFILAMSLVIPGSSVWSKGPAPFTVEMHYNYIDGSTNEWVSTGAFVDFGVIGVSETIHSDTPGVSKVVGPIIADDGSTITWKFHKRYSATGDPNVAASTGEFHILKGTGKYAGFKGHGRVNGLVNVVTGEIVDVFTGQVRLP